jgi:hypothetical protein
LQLLIGKGRGANAADWGNIDIKAKYIKWLSVLPRTGQKEKTNALLVRKRKTPLFLLAAMINH